MLPSCNLEWGASKMLNDGYSWQAQIGDLRIIYRPSLKADRARILRLRSQLGSMWLTDWIWGHAIEWGNGHLIADELRMKCRDSEQSLLAAAAVVLGISDPCVADSPWTFDWEGESAKNLMEGVELEHNHPQFAHRDCESCRVWWYNDETGQICRRTPAGPPIRRPENAVLLCQTPAGCPKGTPEKPLSLTPYNRQALQHYMICRASGNSPDDPIFRRNAVIIGRILNQPKRAA